MGLCYSASFVPDGHGSRCIRRLYKIWKNNVSLLIRFRLGFEHALWHVGCVSDSPPPEGNLQCSVRIYPVSTDRLNPLALKPCHVLVERTSTGPHLQLSFITCLCCPEKILPMRKDGPHHNVSSVCLRAPH